MTTYAVDDVKRILNKRDHEFEVWVEWLTQRGVGPQEGRLKEPSVLALAAAMRFHTTGPAPKKLHVFLESLFTSPPEAGSDWVAVDRPHARSIQIEPGPFKAELRSADRMPIVFDPHPLLEQLEAL